VATIAGAVGADTITGASGAAAVTGTGVPASAAPQRAHTTALGPGPTTGADATPSAGPIVRW
jgi:hypothetical protein